MDLDCSACRTSFERKLKIDESVTSRMKQKLSMKFTGLGMSTH